MVLKESCDVKDKLGVRFQKVLIGISYFIELCGSCLLQKHLQ